jgi:hypothetical protein
MSTTQQPPTPTVAPEPTEPKRRNRPPGWVIVAGVVLVIWAIVAMWPNSTSGSADYPSSDTGGYTAPVISQSSDQQLFLAAVNANTRQYYPNQVLLRVGHTVCDSLDQGLSYQTIVALGFARGVDPYDLGVVMGGAVGAFCPEHQGELP